MQTTLRIRTRQEINYTPVVAVTIAINIHRALVADLASGVRAKGAIADSLSTLFGSIAAVGVAGTGTSLAALRDVEKGR